MSGYSRQSWKQGNWCSSLIETTCLIEYEYIGIIFNEKLFKFIFRLHNSLHSKKVTIQNHPTSISFHLGYLSNIDHWWQYKIQQPSSINLVTAKNGNPLKQGLWLRTTVCHPQSFNDRVTNETLAANFYNICFCISFNFYTENLWEKQTCCQEFNGKMQ